MQTQSWPGVSYSRYLRILCSDFWGVVCLASQQEAQCPKQAGLQVLPTFSPIVALEFESCFPQSKLILSLNCNSLKIPCVLGEKALCFPCGESVTHAKGVLSDKIGPLLPMGVSYMPAAPRSQSGVNEMTMFMAGLRLQGHGLPKC